MKKIVCFFVVICISLSCVSIVFGENGRYPMPAAVVGEPLIQVKSEQIIATAEIEGKDYFFSALSGNPAKLVVYNLDDKVLVDEVMLTSITTPRDMQVDSKKNIYITGDGALSRYNPTEKKIKNFGFLKDGSRWSYTVTVDDRDNVYVGTHPTGTICKIDGKTDKVTDWSVPDSSAQYAYQLTYHDGFVYASTYMGKADTILYKIDTRNPSRIEKIDVSEGNGTRIEMLVAFENKLLMKISADQLAVYIPKTGKIERIKLEKGIRPFQFPEPRENKTYFYSNEGAQSILTSFDMETYEMKRIGFGEAYPRMGGKGNCWVTIEDPDFPGESICSVVGEGSYPVFINPVTGKSKAWTEVNFPGTKVAINNLGTAPGRIVASTFITGQSATYDIQSKSFIPFIISAQAEGMVYYDGMMYFGCYSDGSLRSHDLNAGSTYKKLGVIGERQQRPFAMVAAEEKIFMGSVPDYQNLKGALSWYDLKTNAITTKVDIIKDQSVMQLAYKDGIIYGTTRITGGTGSVPTEKEAKVFMYDIAKDEIIKAFTPDVKGVTDKSEIGGCKFAADGSLWFGMGNILFSLDMETEKVLDVVKTDSPSLVGKEMATDEDGYLYALDKRAIYVVNTKDLTYNKITDKGNINHFTLGDDNNLYYALFNGTQLKVVPMMKKPVNSQGIQEVRELLADKLSLMVDEPRGVKNGKALYIDENNHEIAPIVENGRTLVPVRFIAESLGAEVSWEDSTQTATLVKDDTKVEVTLNKTELLVKGETVVLDVPAKERGGRTLLPLRAIADAFGKQVFWHDSGIIILSDEEVTTSPETIEMLQLYYKYYILEDLNQ